MDLNKNFEVKTTYYWRVVALDESGGMVEMSREVFSFWFTADFPFSKEFTVIAGLVKSDFNQLGLAGARVALGSNAKNDDSVAAIEFNGEYIVIAFTETSNSFISSQIEITFTKDGFKPTTVGLQTSERQNGVITPDDLVMESIGDVDGDGIKDAAENASSCLDAEDADNDGIQDGTELGLTLSDIGADTDTASFQPDLEPSTKTKPLNDDSDNDGLSDGEEDLNRNGRLDAGETETGFLAAGALPASLSLLLGD